MTDRDRVVAELGPPRAGRSTRLSDALLADAVREGSVTAADASYCGFAAAQTIMKLRDLLKDIAFDGGDR